jgi:hypothetical protein
MNYIQQLLAQMGINPHERDWRDKDHLSTSLTTPSSQAQIFYNVLHFVKIII